MVRNRQRKKSCNLLKVRFQLNIGNYNSIEEKKGLNVPLTPDVDAGVTEPELGVVEDRVGGRAVVARVATRNDAPGEILMEHINIHVGGYRDRDELI